MDYKVLLQGVLAGPSFNLPQTEIDPLLDGSKTEAEVQAVLLAKDADRITGIVAPLERKVTEQKDYGFRKGSEELETKLKNKLALDKALKGDALVDAVAEKLTSTATMPEDQVKVSKPYRDLQESVTNMKTEHENALTQLKTGYEEKGGDPRLKCEK